MNWRWYLWRGRARDAFIPFHQESQEDFLRVFANEVVRNRRLGVVVAFRGCRKTKTAERMVFRSTFLWPLFPYYWRRKFVLIKNVNQYQQYFTSETSQMVARYKDRLWAYAFRVMSAAAFTTATLAASGQKMTSSMLEWIPSPDESLGLATFFVFFVFFVRRRKIYIIDDALRYGVAHGHKRHNLQLMLDDIKSLGRSSPVLLLSSNEGITELFGDKNNTTFHFRRCPAAPEKEFLCALHKAHPVFLERAQLKHVRSMWSTVGMDHHVKSVRWWMMVVECQRSLREGALDDWLQIIAYRTVQRMIALTLDLQSEPVAASYAIAYSEPVVFAAALKGYFTTTEIQLLVSARDVRSSETVPRRLVLPLALLMLDHLQNSLDVEAKRFCIDAAGILLPDSHLDDRFPENAFCIEVLQEIREWVTKNRVRLEGLR